MLINGVPVSQYVLREGDRLEIGETGFLFEIPQRFHAARFSNVSICLDSETDAPLRVLEREALPPLPPTPFSDMMLHLSWLFESDSEGLPDALNDMMRQLLGIFDAVAGSLLLRTSTGEATPLVAVAPAGEDALNLPREAVSRALTASNPVLIGAVTRGAAKTDAPGVDPSPRRPRRALLVPLVQRDRIFGVLHLERAEGRDFSPEDVAQCETL